MAKTIAILLLIIPLYVGANQPPAPSEAGELVEELEDAFKGIKWRFVRIPVRSRLDRSRSLSMANDI